MGEEEAFFRWMFFHEQAMEAVKNMTLYFPAAARSPLGLLPRHVAESIPFSMSSLPAALAQLGIAEGSVEAARMEETLHMCESTDDGTSDGDAKLFCTTSLEALVEGAMDALGTTAIRPVTSELPRSGAPLLQTYTIRGVRRVDGSSFLSCHEDDYYPYTVYMCHGTGTTRAYMVDMDSTSTGGLGITIGAVCHNDTSHWNPEHVSFEVLGTKPGGAPVCHYLPYGHMMWASMAKRSSPSGLANN